MKKFTVMIIAFISISIQGSAQGIIIEKKNSSYNDSNHQRVVSITPTSSYDALKQTLFIWTNKGECDVTISIYKDDEEVAYETIFVEPGEEISCDFSDCEAGEYTIYTTVDGEMELIDTITVK